MKYSSSKNDYLRGNNQKVKIVILRVIEMYSIITSSLFLTFIPTKCVVTVNNIVDECHVCSLNETLQWSTILYNTVLIINFGTLSFFILIYIYEFYREIVLNRYLSVTNNVSNEDEDIEYVLDQIPNIYKLKLMRVNNNYKLICYIAIFSYIINSVISGCYMYKNFLNIQILITFIACILVTFIKILDTLEVIYTNPHIFYSSYFKTNVQFNYIDGNKEITI